ncbi:MAG: cellulose biosynthesis protein BcsG, partial [Proteobacteria bacterium]|nr:cellulose biosynthesis protein BcsG [Pseudomonadota bacterium]
GAVRGDKRQIAGLREIPTPGIALVPVGIKVIGAHRQGESLTLDQPSSFLAISHIIGRMLEKSPFDGGQFSPSIYTVDLPVTSFVAQNENTTVAEFNGQYFISRGNGKLDAYSEFNKP